MANTLTAHLATIIAQEALLQLKGNLGIAKRVNRNYEPEIAQYGKVVSVPKYGSLTANNKTAGSGRTVQDVTSTSVSVTLNKHKEATFVIDDIEKAMSRNDLISGYLNSAVVAIATAVESDIFATYANAAETVGTAGTAIDEALIRTEVRPLLVNAKAPMTDGNLSLYVTAEDYAELLNPTTTGFLRADVLGAQGATGLAEGALGKLFGFQVFESSFVTVASGNHNLAFHKDAITLAVRDLPDVPTGMGAVSSTVSDPETGLSMRVRMNYDSSIGGVAVTVEMLYGIGVLRDDFIVDIVS